MSGYLGRMLRAAAGGEQRLHSLAGSVYADGEGAADASSGVKSREGQATRQDQDSPERKRLAVPPAIGAELAKMPASGPAATLDKYQPLQPRNRELKTHGLDSAESNGRAHEKSEPVQGLRERDVSGAGATHVQGPSNAQARSGARAAESTAIRAQVTAEDGPVGDAQDRRVVPPRVEPIPRNTAQTIASGTQSGLARQQYPPSMTARDVHSEESDVQVNIGRIEVLAVQPPAPAAPAPRRERSTSLANYLAARNGRGR